MALYLKEHLTFDRANMVVESTGDGDLKALYMKGIFIQGGVKNANDRVYPVSEIESAVETLNSQLKEGYSVLGEVDHPDILQRPAHGRIPLLAHRCTIAPCTASATPRCAPWVMRR